MHIAKEKIDMKEQLFWDV